MPEKETPEVTPEPAANHPLGANGIRPDGAAATWAKRAQDTLDGFRQMKPGWDSYDADPPNSTAIYWAGKVIETLSRADFEPSRIVPSAEGGIAIVFVCEPKYADIEVFNTGEILAVMSDRKSEPRVWAVAPQDIEGSVERIREYVRS
jgi:hypothetical protein